MEQDRLRFWKELFQIKVQVIFVQGLWRRSERIERYIKMFLAIASSASVGAWIIWKELAWLWAAVVAVSQVLTTIQPLLPYAERQKKFALVLRDFELLFMASEFDWQSMSGGELSSKKINSLTEKLKRKKLEILHRHMPGDVFPTNVTLANEAEVEANSYFAYHYAVDMT